jgi:integrase
VDVAEERQERRRREHDAPAIAKAADEFLSVYVRTKLKPRSAAEYERLLHSIIIPALGHRKLEEVTHADIEQLHHRLKGTPAQANRAIAVLSKLFSWAIRHGQLPDRINPCRGLERYKERSRNRFLSEVELAGLGLALERGVSSGRLSPWAAAAVRLLLFTGARLNEILSLRWDYVDLDNGLLRLPDSKTGAKVIVLNGPARAVLAEIPRRSDNPYVLPGNKDGQHRVDLKKPWQLVCNLAGVTGVRLHDLRHTNAALGVASGLSLPLIGGLLGHKQTPRRNATHTSMTIRSERQLRKSAAWLRARWAPRNLSSNARAVRSSPYSTFLISILRGAALTRAKPWLLTALPVSRLAPADVDAVAPVAVSEFFASGDEREQLSSTERKEITWLLYEEQFAVDNADLLLSATAERVPVKLSA